MGEAKFEPRQRDDWDAALEQMPPMRCGRLDMASYNARGEPERFVYVDGTDERTRVSGPWCDEVAYAAQRYKPMLEEIRRLRALLNTTPAPTGGERKDG